jgi:hypothetical protein
MEVRSEITVEIESLVIEGLTRREAERAALAFQGELQRLFTERGLPAGVGSGKETLTVETPLQLRPGAAPEKLGAQAAQALFASWE